MIKRIWTFTTKAIKIKKQLIRPGDPHGVYGTYSQGEGKINFLSADSKCMLGRYQNPCERIERISSYNHLAQGPKDPLITLRLFVPGKETNRVIFLREGKDLILLKFRKI